MPAKVSRTIAIGAHAAFAVAAFALAQVIDSFNPLSPGGRFVTFTSIVSLVYYS
jgi:hypothetical protein